MNEGLGNKEIRKWLSEGSWTLQTKEDSTPIKLKLFSTLNIIDCDLSLEFVN